MNKSEKQKLAIYKYRFFRPAHIWWFYYTIMVCQDKLLSGE